MDHHAAILRRLRDISTAAAAAGTNLDAGNLDGADLWLRRATYNTTVARKHIKALQVRRQPAATLPGMND